MGYKCETAWRRGQDAVLIGYDKEKYKLVDKKEISYNDLYEKYDYERDFKRHNVALIVLLMHRETHQHIVVVNTHLFWNKVFDHVKYGQAYWLLHKVALFLRDHGISLESEKAGPQKLWRSGAISYTNTPLIMCGDFNSRPSSSVMHMIHDQKYDIEQADTQICYKRNKSRILFNDVKESYE